MTGGDGGDGSQRVAVVGATSQVAGFLIPRLIATGKDPVAITRGAPVGQGLATHVIREASGGGRADFDPPLPMAAALVTTAPLRALDTALAAARACRARHIVAISSMSRYAKAGSGSPAERAAADLLAQGEARLAAICAKTGTRWTILRPTMVYGGGADRNVAFIARVIRRTGLFPIPPGAKGLRQPIHADDLAAACLAALTRPEAADRAFNVGGGDRIPYPEMVRRIFEAMGRRPRIVPVPAAAFRLLVALGRTFPPLAFVSPEMVRRMYDDLIADNGEAARCLGHRPRPFYPDRGALGSGGS